MKRVFSVLLTTVIFILSTAVYACAIENVRIEQVSSYFPKLTIAVKAKSSDKISENDCFAKFGEDSLIINSVEQYDSSKHKSAVYFLVDISDSVEKGYFDAAKKKLVEYSNKLPSNDRMILLSFGKKVSTVLNGTENKEARTAAINALKRTDSETNLYNAISKAVEMSRSETSEEYDRSFAVVLSDGENFETSGGNTEQEVKDSLAGHGLPIYAFCMGGSRENASSFGSFARSSGGEIFTVNSYSAVSKTFDNLVQTTKNICLITARTKSNIPYDGTTKNLMIRINDKSDSVDVKASRWIKDDDAPEILSAETKVNDNGEECVYIYFSENVYNADDPANFTLTRNDGKKEFGFINAEYFFENGSYYSVLTPQKRIAKHDDYKIECTGITDSSNEQHSLVNPEYDFTLGSKSEIVVFFISYWWIIAAVLLLSGAVVALVQIKRKNKTTEKAESQAQNHITPQPVPMPINDYEYPPIRPIEKHHIVMPEGKKIVMKISNGKTVVRTVEATVCDTLTVGRSDSCDVYFDDLKMSRRHFEIQREGDELWVNDLGSANGTILNNIIIKGRRKLVSNDVIIAGQQTIVILF